MLFGILLGTDFENCKKDFATWVHFVGLMTWNVPIEACAELCGITHQTAFEWRHRVFATVDGFRTVSSSKAASGSTRSTPTTPTSPRDAGKRARGGFPNRRRASRSPSTRPRTQWPSPTATASPRPRGSRTRSAVAKGSTDVHDRERAHNGIIADRSCKSEAYKADVTDPVYLDAMEMANNLSSWLKRYLWRFTSMDPAQSSVLPELVCAPVPRAPSRGQMAQNRKGGPPFAHGRRDSPHVDGHIGSPHC